MTDLVQHNDLTSISGVLKQYYIMKYHQIHSILEKRLKRKYLNGHKIRVAIIASESSQFECKSIYYNLLNYDDIFDPFIIVVSRGDKYLSDHMWSELIDHYKCLKKKGYNVVLGYNEKKQFIGLDKFLPDIVINDFPKIYVNGHSNDLLFSLNYLTCYVPYGYTVVNNPKYHFENIHILVSWKIFVTTYYSYYQLQDINPNSSSVNDVSSRSFLNKAVPVGYPKLDAYSEKPLLPPKINNGKPVVIYAPHWSIREFIGYFDQYYQDIMDYAINHQDINFVFKPHPFLIHQIAKLSKENPDFDLTVEKYIQYEKQWSNLKNGIVIKDGDYISIFKASTCLITDSGSFIGEYLPSLHPCIYILGEHSSFNNYNEAGQQILRSYYCVSNKNSLIEKLNDIIYNNNDSLLPQRMFVLKNQFINIGNSGQSIVEEICSSLHIKK